MTQTGIEGLDRSESPAVGGEDPVITVVVPTYNRGRALPACLRALARQTLDAARFEVIVCDDGSASPIAAREAELVSGLAGALRLRFVRQPNAGPAAARNLGAAMARGRYLAFTDDDCVPASDWLERLLARLETHPDALIGGGLSNGLPDNVYAAATQAIMDFVYGDDERRARTRLFSTSNLAVAAVSFDRIGGFSPEFPDAAGEDYDLCWRWQEAGFLAEYVPDAVVVHHHPLTMRGYLGQHFRYGRGLLRVRRRRGARRQSGAGRGPAFYARLVMHPLRRWWQPGAWRCAVLIAASQVATMLGAVVEFVRPSQSRAATPARQPVVPVR